MNAFENAGLQQLMEGLFPSDKQEAFEKADLQEDASWIDANYDVWHQQMNVHALASFGTFEWTFYRKWLQANRARPGAEEALANFQGHPAKEQYE